MASEAHDQDFESVASTPASSPRRKRTRAVIINLTDCRRKQEWPHGETITREEADKIALTNKNSSDPVRNDFYKIRTRILPLDAGKGKGWLGKKAIEALNPKLMTDYGGKDHFAGGHGIALKSPLCRQAEEWIEDSDDRFTEETGIPLILWRFYHKNRCPLQPGETVSSVEEYLNGPSSASSSRHSITTKAPAVKTPATRQKHISSATSRKRNYAESCEQEKDDNNCSSTDDDEEPFIPSHRRLRSAAQTTRSLFRQPAAPAENAENIENLENAENTDNASLSSAAAVVAAKKKHGTAVLQNRATTIVQIRAKIIRALHDPTFSTPKPKDLLLALLMILNEDQELLYEAVLQQVVSKTREAVQDLDIASRPEVMGFVGTIMVAAATAAAATTEDEDKGNEDEAE